jgi:hypothetical protein
MDGDSAGMSESNAGSASDGPEPDAEPSGGRRGPDADIGAVSPETLGDAADAFAAVGNEYRIEILRTLAEQADYPVAYSDLRKGIDEQDTGRLNYHLGELLGTFVWKDDDEGYGLTLSGRRLVSSILAGRYHDDDATRSASAPGACLACGERSLRLEQPGQRGLLVCTACDAELVNASFPTGAWNGRPDEAVPEVFAHYVKRVARDAGKRICPECTAGMDAEPVPDVLGFEYAMGFDCTACPRWTAVPFGMLTYFDDTVRTFLHRAGVETDEGPFWTVAGTADHDAQTVVATDPLTVEVTFETDDARCVATLDATGSVTHVREEWNLDGD